MTRAYMFRARPTEFDPERPPKLGQDKSIRRGYLEVDSWGELLRRARVASVGWEALRGYLGIFLLCRPMRSSAGAGLGGRRLGQSLQEYV